MKKMNAKDNKRESSKPTAAKVIGAIIAIVGIFAAVCVTDGSRFETAIRFGGIAMFAIGAYLAKAFDFQKGGAR